MNWTSTYSVSNACASKLNFVKCKGCSSSVVWCCRLVILVLPVKAQVATGVAFRATRLPDISCEFVHCGNPYRRKQKKINLEIQFS